MERRARGDGRADGLGLSDRPGQRRPEQARAGLSGGAQGLLRLRRGARLHECVRLPRHRAVLARGPAVAPDRRDRGRIECGRRRRGSRHARVAAVAPGRAPSRRPREVLRARRRVDGARPRPLAQPVGGCTRRRDAHCGNEDRGGDGRCRRARSCLRCDCAARRLCDRPPRAGDRPDVGRRGRGLSRELARAARHVARTGAEALAVLPLRRRQPAPDGARAPHFLILVAIAVVAAAAAALAVRRRDLAV